MHRISAVTLFALLAVAGCKKEKKADPAMAGSGSPSMTADKPVDKPVDTGSGSAVADKPADMTGSGSGSAAAAPVGSGSGSAAAAKPAELKWEKYTSKEGGFSIELPSKPEEQEQQGMKIVGAQFGTTATDNRGAMCGVAFMNLGDAAKGDPKTMLDGATARHKQGAKVIEEKDIKIGKYPGRSIVVENDSHRKWMRVFLVEKNIYVLNCGGPFDRAATDGPIATKTLDSFALTKK